MSVQNQSWQQSPQYQRSPSWESQSWRSAQRSAPPEAACCLTYTRSPGVEEGDPGESCRSQAATCLRPSHKPRFHRGPTAFRTALSPIGLQAPSKIKHELTSNALLNSDVFRTDSYMWELLQSIQSLSRRRHLLIHKYTGKKKKDLKRNTHKRKEFQGTEKSKSTYLRWKMWEHGKACSCWSFSPMDSPHIPQYSSSSSTHCRNFTTCSLSSSCCSLLRKIPSLRQCTLNEHSWGEGHAQESQESLFV